MELYLNIKKRREELGLSQEELAKETGYTSRTSIAKIESGKVDLPQSKIEMFAKALKTTPSELMGWEEKKYPSRENIEAVEINDRIIELRLSKGMTQGELAKALDLSASSIGMYEQGRRKPSYKLLEKISDYFNVDMDYLMGKSDIKNKYQLENKTFSEINPQNTYNFLNIPLYASISAGYGSCQAEFIEMLPVPGLKPNGTEYFAVRVVGNSMEPKIPNNSIIIIKKDIAIENGEIGAFCFNETSYVKQKRVVNGRLILHSFNLAYEPIMVTEYDDFKEYGKVVKVLIDL